MLDINSGIEACNVLFNDLADNKYKYAIGLHSQMMKIYEKKLIKMKMKIEGLFQPGKGLKNKLLISRKLKNNICQKNPLSKF